MLAIGIHLLYAVHVIFLSTQVDTTEIIYAEGSGKPDELKDSGCPLGAVWGGAVGKAGYAARWPPTLRE